MRTRQGGFNNSPHVAYQGIGVAGFIGIGFVLMKVADYGPVGKWSWWWVTLPFWIGPAIVVVLFALAGVFVMVRRYVRKAVYAYQQEQRRKLK